MSRSPAPSAPGVASRSTPSTPSARPRWPYAGRGQGLVLVGALLAAVGSLLPWVQTAVVSFNGLNGGGLYTFALAWVGVAGALVRRRRVALWHAAAAGVVCTALPLWQLAHLWSLGLGLPGAASGWYPGIGLAMVLGGGLLVLRGAWHLGHMGRKERTAG